MSTRAALALAVLLAGNGASSALETAPFVRDDDTESPWRASGSCTISYANTCTGWLYHWRMESFRTYGVVFDPCCENTNLESTAMRFTAASMGYPMLAEVSTADENGCPETSLAQKTFITTDSEWHSLDWGIPCSGPIVVTVSFVYNHGVVNGLAAYPGQGPTGPAACGNCYPVGQPAHSFYYGAFDDTICPPIPYVSGGCPIELLWSAAFSCAISTESDTWGQLKALYR
ncbi:hypothetical protein K8I85_06245 [bacterium]|nr:hypothetical protein [bacterium]